MKERAFLEERKEPTEAERKLWDALSERKLEGFRFRRQQPLGPYMVDFFCLTKGLVVEVDSSPQASREARTSRRSVWLEENGYQIFRCRADQVMNQLEIVLADLLKKLKGLPDRPRPRPAEKHKASASKRPKTAFGDGAAARRRRAAAAGDSADRPFTRGKKPGRP